jgi:hypothetical protein
MYEFLTLRPKRLLADASAASATPWSRKSPPTGTNISDRRNDPETAALSAPALLLLLVIVIAPVDPLSRRIVHRSIWKLHLIAIANDLIKSAQSRFAQLKHFGAALNIPHPVARQFDGLGIIHFSSLNYSDRLTAAKIHRDFEPSSFDGVAIWPGHGVIPVKILATV